MRTIEMVAVAIGILLLGFGCDTRSSEPTAPNGNGDDDYSSITSAGITLHWKTDQSGLLYAKVRAGTTGWVAVGFNPTNGMHNANLILGYVDGGAVLIRDDFGTSPTTHQADASLGGSDDVTNAAGSEQGGMTEISFTIPLDSGDAYDRVLLRGQTYPVLLAHGPNGVDDFTTAHQTRAVVNIQI